MIFILNRYGRIIGILSNKRGTKSSPFFDDVLVEDLKTGAETYSFSTIINKDSTDITVGNYIAFKRKGKFKLFQIVSTEENHSEQELEITAYCESAGLELLNKVIRARKLTSFTLKKFLETVLTETGWEVGFISGVAKDRVQDIELEDSSVYATLQNNLGKFGVELEFRVEINNGIITGRYIDVYSSRGKVTGKRFEFGKDINNIHRKIDSSELFTALIGVGKNGVNFKDVKVDGINKPLGQDFVADEEAFQRYNNRGYHLMGVFKFETESPEELLRETYKQLQKSKNPKIEYEVDVALLGDAAIGDTVAIVDNAFNPPIHLMARVTKLETSKTDDSKNKCTLANFVEVSSNITSQMRALASKLEGYVDSSISSKFPIGSDDIKNNAIHGNHIIKDSITTQHLKADFIEALDARFESLKAKDADLMNLVSLKANIKDLTATNATIQNLITDFHQSKESLIEKANIMEANIKDLKAIKVNAEDFKAIVGEIDNLKTKIEKVNFLEGDLAKIKTLVGGNISSENIQSGGITGDRLNMKTVFIDDANILNINASKITSGEINTSKILLKSEDGGMKLIGSTQQFLDKKGNVRIQLGKDNKGNFDFYIIDDKGNILFNTNGITGNAISKGLIKGEMIGKGEVGGELINWASFTNEFNKDTNTNKLKASKIVVDKTGQTIDAKFDTVEKKLDQTKETVDSHTTQLNIQQGKISSIIADSEIEKDGKKVKLKDAYNTTVKTVDSMKEVISKQKTIIDEHTGKIVATETKTNEVIKDLNSTTSRVSATETNVNNIKDSINKINTEIETGKTKVSEVKHNLDGITIKVGETEKVVTSHSNQITNINNKVDNIKIGGRNLAQLTQPKEFTSFSGRINECQMGYDILLDTLDVGDQVTVSYVFSYEDLIPAPNQKDYAIWLQGCGDVTQWTCGCFPSGTQLTKKIKWGKGNSDNIKVEYTFTLDKDAKKNRKWSTTFRMDYIQSGKVKVSDFMVEYGTHKTSYTPAPEDLQFYAEQVAIAKSKLAKEETIALLDGKISEEEKKRIKQAQDNLNIAIAKINEVENKAKAHAEQMKNDIISHSDALGQKLKADAEKFANEVAIAKSNLAKEQAIVENNKKIAEEEQKRIKQAEENLAKAIAKANEAESKAIAHAEQLDKQLKVESEKYAEQVALAKSELAKQQAIAIADGKISAEEQKRIKQAEDNLKIAINKAEQVRNDSIKHSETLGQQLKNDAQKYAEQVAIAKSNLAKEQAISDAKNKIAEEEQKRLAEAKKNLDMAITKANEVAELKKNEAINTSKTNISKAIDGIEIGGENLVSNLPENWEVGSINQSVALGSDYNQVKYQMTTRLRVKDLIEIKDIFSISYNNSLFSCCLALFDSNKKYLGVTSGFVDWLNTGVYKHNTKVEYVAIIVRFKNDANITLKDLDKLKLKVEHGNKVTGFSLSQNDLKKYANDVAIAKSDLAKQQAIANADGKISAEEQKRIKQAQDNLNIAIAKANEAESKAKTHAENLDKQLKNDAQKYAEQVAIAKSNLAKEQAIADAANKVAQEEQKRLKQAQDNLNTAIARTEKAKQDAINHAEDLGKRLKADAQKFANDVAIAKSELIKQQVVANLDGKISEEEKKRIAEAKKNLDMAIAKANEVAEKSRNHANEIAELKKNEAINTSLTNTNNALNNLQIGGRNLIRKDDLVKFNTDGSYDSTNNTWTLVAANKAGDYWGAGLRISGEKVIVPYGQGYILSFEVKVPVDCEWNIDVNCFPSKGSCWSGNDNDDVSKRKTSSKKLEANKWIKCWSYWENTSTKNTSFVDLHDNCNFGVINNTGKDLKFEIRNIKGELGNKASDWTPAPEDLKSYSEQVAIAKSELAKQQAIANADGKISAEEQKRIKQAQDNLNTAIAKANDAQNKAIAHAEQVKKDLTTYTNNVAEQKKNDAINAAKGYTNNQVSEVNVKVKDADANIKILKDQIKSKVTQVEIDKSLKNIKFGGRNLALQTQPKEYSGFTGRENDCQFNTEVLLDSLSIGDPVTISFKFKYENLESQPNFKGLLLRTQGSGDVTGWGSGSFPCYDFTKQVVFGKGKSGEIRIEYNYIITDDSKKNKKWYFNIRMDGVAKGKINFSEFMVEYGTHRTAYTPAPEDVQKAIVDSKNEVTEKINKATSEITQTKDSINASVKSLQSETQKITTNVANLDKNLTNKITSNLNDAKNFANQIAEQKKIDAINHANNIAEQKKSEAIKGARIIPDTRNDNQSPNWYITNYPRQTITEFKYSDIVKIPNSKVFGTLETKVPWDNQSGGLPTQVFRSNAIPTYQRHGKDLNTWSDWEQIENTTGSQAKVNAGVDVAKQYTNTQITTVNQKVSNVESSINVLKGKIESKVSQTDVENTVIKYKTQDYGYAYKKDIVIYGDHNLYYPVIIKGGDQNVKRKILIKRSYAEQAPSEWNPDLATHHGGLTLLISANFGGWGGANYSWNIYDLEEQYSRMFAGAQNCASNMAFAIFLRGGGKNGAIYHLYSDQPLEGYIGWEKENVPKPPQLQIAYKEEMIGFYKPAYEFFAPKARTITKEVEEEIKKRKFIELAQSNANEILATNNKISTVESKLVQENNSIKASVSSLNSKTTSLEQNLNGKATKNEVSEVNKQVSSIKADLGGITQRVSNTETKTNSLQSQVDGKASKSELVTTNQKVASIETNMNGITQKVSSTESTTKKISDDLKLKEDKNYRTIYAKGWGNDFINARDVRVSGVRVDDSNTRGLSVVALNPLTLSVEFKQAYDTFGNDAERKNFVAKINELNNGNHIIVITSADAASLTNGEVCEVLYKIGGSAPGTSTPSYREAYALIGKSSLGKGNGVEMYIPFTSQIKRVAEVSVKVSEAGSFLGVNCNNIALALDKANQETKTVKEKFTEFKQSTESFNWVVGQRSSISNILPNGSFIGGDRGWLHNGSEFWSGPYNGYGFKGRFTGAIRNKTNFNNPERYLQTTKAYKVKKNTDYTISFHYACEMNVHSMEAFVILSNTEAGDYAQPIRVLERPGGTQSNPGEEKPFTYKFNTGNHEWVWVRFDHNGMKDGTNWEQYCWLYVSEVAIYEGDVGNVKWVAKGGESYSNHFQMDMDGFKASFPNGSYTLLDKDGFEWYDAGSGHSYHALAYVTSFGIPAGNPGKAWVKLPREFTKRKKSLKWTVALRGYYYSTYGNFFPFHVHVSGTNEYEENGIIVCPIEGYCRIQNASNPNDVQPQPVTAMLIAVA